MSYSIKRYTSKLSNVRWLILDENQRGLPVAGVSSRRAAEWIVGRLETGLSLSSAMQEFKRKIF